MWRIRMADSDLITALYESMGEQCVTADDVAHVEVHGNEVLAKHLVEGLRVEAEKKDGALNVYVNVGSGVHIENPVRFCFGMIPKTGRQRIVMRVVIEKNASLAALSSCTFPNAVDVLHSMDAEIDIAEGAEYIYLERHVHGPEGGVTVLPKAKVRLRKNAKFRSDFELIRGMVGEINIQYDAVCEAGSVLEMSARVSGGGRDRIFINEKAHLAGEESRGVLMTKIAVRDQATAEIRNTLVASAAGARGHVDCKEIVQGGAVAEAVPVVKVEHPKAHVTHEAAIGSVDSKQLETIMSRGLDENAASQLIIDGLLAPQYGKGE
jgi:Fe-S cluster assembly scaffold protein SufB